MSHLYFNGNSNNPFALDATLTAYLTDTTNPIAPAYSTEGSQAPRLLKSQFGDGYSQRMPDGINNNPRKFSVVFKTSVLISRALKKFFEGTVAPYVRGTNEFFYWTPPAPYDEQGKYTASNWSFTPETYNAVNCSVTFEEVFDAEDETVSYNPSAYNGLILWFKADSFSLTDSTAIGGSGLTWVDQSDSLNNAAQATTANKPLFRTTANVPGWTVPGIQFDGAASPNMDYLTISEIQFNSLDPFTFIFGGQITTESPAALRILMGRGDTATQYIGVETVTNRWVIHSTGGDSWAPTNMWTTDGLPRMMTFRRSGGKLYFREDKDDAGMVDFNSSLYLSQIGKSLLTTSPFKGLLGDIVVYNTCLTDAQVDSLYDNYFRTRYNLPS